MIARYVHRALERAQYRQLPDGTFAATVRGLRGVVATGDTLEACRHARTRHHGGSPEPSPRHPLAIGPAPSA